MSKNASNYKTIEGFLKVFFGLLAISAIQSVFEDDSSKIVSKKGRLVLSDNAKMKEINEEILKSEKNNSYNEVIVDL